MKFSQVPTNNSPAIADFMLGVSTGNVDQKTTIAALAALISLNLTDNTVSRSKMDWSTFANNIKGAKTTTTNNPANNVNQSLGGNGAQVSFTLATTGYVFIQVDVACGSSSDFEFRPLVFIDGVLYTTNVMSPPASVGNASGRHVERVVTAVATLAAGAHTLAAGVYVNSATSPTVSGDGASIHAMVFGNVTA